MLQLVTDADVRSEITCGLRRRLPLIDLTPSVCKGLGSL